MSRRPSNATKYRLYGPWFKAQFGRAPSPSKIIKLRQRCVELSDALADAEAQLRAEQSLMDAFSAGLYAWNARAK